MSLKDSAEVAGIVAIVISLIVLIVEVRQNTIAIRSNVVQSITEQSHNHQQIWLSTPELRLALKVAVEGTPTSDQQALADVFYAMQIQTNLNRFEQMQIGMVDKNFVLANGANARMYRRKNFKEFWNRQKELYPTGFQQFMEDVVMAPIAYDVD